MNIKTALNAPRRVLREFARRVAPKVRTALPANPALSSIDFNDAPPADTPIHKGVPDSYLVAIHYPLSSDRIPEGYRSDIRNIASCYRIAF